MSLYQPGRPLTYNPSTGSGHEPPAKPGEYRLRDDDKNIAYIGETCNLKRRINEHIRSGMLPTGEGSRNFVEYKVADESSSTHARRVHEQEKIAQHKPFLNHSKGGEGRIARK